MTQINQSILWSRFPVLTFGLDLNEGQCSFFDYMLHCTHIGNIVKNNLSFAFNSNRGLNSTHINHELVSKMIGLPSLTTANLFSPQRTMTIEIQPPQNLHPRYESDGKRYIENSRKKPMVIKLPNLRAIRSNFPQTFLIRLALITHSDNPFDPVYIHPNIFEYHSTDTIIFNDGTIGVVLRRGDIELGTKTFSHLTIVKQKLSRYKPTLRLLQLVENESDEETNTNETKPMSVKTAKEMVKKYNLTASKIFCQLLIKQNEMIYGTDITCVSHVLEYNERFKNSTSKKRSAGTMDEGNVDDTKHSVKRRQKSN